MKSFTSSDWVLSFNLEPHYIVHRLSLLNGYALNYIVNPWPAGWWEHLMETYAKRNKKYLKKKQIGDGMPFSEEILKICRLKMSAQLKDEKRLYSTPLNDDIEAHILEFIGERNDAISFCIALRVHSKLGECLMMNPNDYETVELENR